MAKEKNKLKPFKAMLEEGKSEAEVRAAMETEGLDADATFDELSKKEFEKGKYKVAQKFRDIVDFTYEFAIDEDVSYMEPGRLKELVEGGLVTKE